MRFWDTKVAHEKDSGEILVQADDDVACISLGDPQKGEHQLVVYVAAFFNGQRLTNV